MRLKKHMLTLLLLATLASLAGIGVNSLLPEYSHTSGTPLSWPLILISLAFLFAAYFPAPRAMSAEPPEEEDLFPTGDSLRRWQLADRRYGVATATAGTFAALLGLFMQLAGNSAWPIGVIGTTVLWMLSFASFVSRLASQHH